MNAMKYLVVGFGLVLFATCITAHAGSSWRLVCDKRYKQLDTERCEILSEPSYQDGRRAQLVVYKAINDRLMLLITLTAESVGAALIATERNGTNQTFEPAWSGMVNQAYTYVFPGAVDTTVFNDMKSDYRIDISIEHADGRGAPYTFKLHGFTRMLTKLISMYPDNY